MPSYRCTRRTLSVVLVGGIACASLLGLTHTAAATVTAASCSGSIAGKVGEAVKLKSETVKEYVVGAVDDGPEAPLLGWKNEQTRMREAFEEGKFEPIKLPKVPDSASTQLKGKRIAKAVLAKIDSVDEVSDIADDEENRKNIKAAVGENCGLTVKATNYTPPTSAQPRTGSGQQGNDQGPSQGQGQSTTTPRQVGGAAPPPSARYGTDGAAPSQRYYGSRTPSSPRATDQPAQPGLPPSTIDPPALSEDIGQSDPNVDNAGNARAIEAERAAAEVRLPLLLAVVALACVAAALVRTWVLRKVS
ncbi:hypothetical protein [Haloechinothrix halophila]|uniref:hypothetical protein n=1 Tax=Haloechinothrix halophila TaxID=1069073 RepID=UPI0003F7D7F3|nr:hypothetical protein [Haloechinothrix halophila]